MSGLCERCMAREERSAHDLYCDACEDVIQLGPQLTAFNRWYEKADDRRLYPAFLAGWVASDRAAGIVPTAPPLTNPDGTLRLLDMAELKAANKERVRRSAMAARNLAELRGAL